MQLSSPWIALSLLAAAIAPASAGGPLVGPSAYNLSVRARIDDVVRAERLRYGGSTPVPGVLIGVWDGFGGAYVRGYGVADLATGRPMTPSDHFRIGSNTKTFVVSVILQLVDEGKLNLDDPLSRFDLGVAVPNAQSITIRQLCEMRSGLFEAYDVPEIQADDVKPNSHFDARTMVRWAVAQKPYFAPGQGYKYSNTNYLLLGLIIEAVAHDSVANQIRSRLLVPFGLTHTSYPDDQAMPDPWAHGYGLDTQGEWHDVSDTIPVSLMGAAGEMVSDMADMRRWITLYVTGKTSAPATAKQVRDCIPIGKGNMSFGLGLGCSAGWFGYTGGLPGYNTADYLFPANGTFILAWVTTQGDRPPPGVANTLVRDIAGVMTPDNVPFTVAPAERQ